MYLLLLHFNCRLSKNTIPKLTRVRQEMTSTTGMCLEGREGDGKGRDGEGRKEV